MAMCLVRGLIFGALANSIEPLLSSNTVHFMIPSQDGMSITAPISVRKCIVGIVSHNAVDKDMRFVSAVDKSILVCSLDFQMIAHPVGFVTNPVLEHADVGSLALLC